MGDTIRWVCTNGHDHRPRSALRRHPGEHDRCAECGAELEVAGDAEIIVLHPALMPR